MATQVLSTSCMQQQKPPALMDAAPGQHSRLMAKPVHPSGRSSGTSARQPGFAVRSLNFDTAAAPPGMHSWTSARTSDASSTVINTKTMTISPPSSSSLNRISAGSSPSSQANTPDSGISGTAFGSMPKTLESDYSLSTLTPPSALSSSSSFSGVGGGICSGTAGGSGSGGSGQRKRKTVTIDESQTSIVMISPDDLYRTYSGMISSFAERQDHSTEEDLSRGNDEEDGENEEEEEEEEDFYDGYRLYEQQQEESGSYCDAGNYLDSFSEGQVSEVPFGSGGVHLSLTDGHNGRFVLDSETGWPLKRSER
ncbi:hypothetical protein RRG08_003290 [Elysia crispata]|uniref:Uncharacterized protein n=1 Tax=Elysia crispata TaxID=231223 RepID=A0AAE1D135_9GAST|nr:hypothetical protein RRG08_003290 [Elysia crispata]